jgi:flagellar protein FlaG
MNMLCASRAWPAANSTPAEYSGETMSPAPQQPQLNLAQSPDYRESYANSVQVRVSVWDFQLIFGLASSETPDQVNIRNHQGIFLSPQQAKALWNVLGQNLAQYEQAFGTLNLEPRGHGFPQGPVN